MKIFSPRDERETIITFGVIEGKAKIWTNEESMINKLDKMVEKFPEVYKCERVWRVGGEPDVIANKEYLVDRRRISFTSPREGNPNNLFKGKSPTAVAENETE